ncbi:MAG: hypothetical protein ABIQ56_06595, partial [Chitinophagaceae bacterium]
MFRFKNFLLLVIVLMSFGSMTARAQYFYNDIWVQQQLYKEFTILKEGNLRTISVKSFEDDGYPSEGFFLQRKINKQFTESETQSKTSFSNESILTTLYNAQGRILRSTDSTAVSIGITAYTYDDKGRLSTISTITRNPGESNNITEERTYSYNTNDKPQKMIRKKSNNVVSEVNFTIDEKGNVIEEQESKGRKYYYYYDAKNRVTDVVHFNSLAKRLLPDYMFEYSSSGQVKQLVSTVEGGNNYFIW